jgi:hypothetical protein
LKVANRFSGSFEEQQVVVDRVCELESSTQCELPRQYSQHTRAELHGQILAGLGRVLVDCGSVSPAALDLD